MECNLEPTGNFGAPMASMLDMDAELMMRPSEPLALPFGTLGAVAGLFAFDLLDTTIWLLREWCVTEATQPMRPDWEQRLPIALLACLSFAVAGRWASSQVATGSKAWWTGMVATLAAVYVPAGFIGLLSLGQLWPLLMKTGLVLSLVTLPCGILLTVSARRAWRSRTESVLIAAYRRARWLDLSLFAIALSALYANPMFGTGWKMGADRAWVAQAIVAIATLGGGAAAVLAMRSLGLLTRARRRCREAIAAAVPIDEASASVVDMGVGDQLAAELVGRGSAYRGRRQATQLLRGDVDRAWTTLLWAFMRAGTAVYLGLFVLWFDGGPYTLPWASPMCG